MSAEVGLEVGALGVGLAAAGVLAAVDGWPLFPSGPPTALPLHPTGGQVRPDQHLLLVAMGRVSRGLGVRVFAVKVGVKVGHVAVVSGVGGHDLWRDEPAVGEIHHRGVLLSVVGAEVPEASSAVSLSAPSLRDFKLIYILCIREQNPRLVLAVTMVIQLRLHRRGFSRSQELGQAAAVHLQALRSGLVLEHVHLLVCCVQVGLDVQSAEVEVRRRVAPLRQQELHVPGCLALVVQELVCGLRAEMDLLRAAQRDRPIVRLPHLE